MVISAIVHPFLISGPDVIGGSIKFSQDESNSHVDIVGTISSQIFHDGFTYNVRINTYGDLSRGAESTGQMFNQVLDVAATAGEISIKPPQSKEITLLPERDRFITGRAVVVYRGTASEPGDAIAWGVIGSSP